MLRKRSLIKLYVQTTGLEDVSSCVLHVVLENDHYDVLHGLAELMFNVSIHSL